MSIIEQRSVIEPSEAAVRPDGRARTYEVRTFGCQMNVLDSELVIGALRRHGYTLTESPADADVLLFNTCSVREHAEEKTFSALGRVQHVKRRNPDAVVGVLGCMAQKDQELIRKRAPYVDMIVGTGQLAAVPELVAKVRETREPQLAVSLPIALARHGADERAAGRPVEGPYVFHCAHRAFGVGMIDVRDVLAAAAGRVAAAHPGVTFAFVGPGDPVSAAGAARVIDAGEADEAQRAAWLDAADLLCLPSAGEIFPVSILEAWSLRTPVLTSDIPTLTELVERAGGGVTAPREPDAVADAILALLADLQRDEGLSCLFISHDLAVVRGVADRVAVMTGGQIVEVGPTERIFTRPANSLTEDYITGRFG